LAGLQAGLSHCETPYLLSVPCDSPFLPTDLAARLALGLEGEYADIAVALAEGRAQPVFSLMRRTVAESLAGFLDSGGRKIDLWTATLRCASVSFEDENAAFRNINTLEDLAQNDKPDA
jgi:molybdopterin-guanine dinucleotide biosynthesis protein A